MSTYLRIATEEAFAPPELLARYRKLLEDGYDDPGFRSLWGFYSGSSPRAAALAERIQDLGDRRLRDMDDTGIAPQDPACAANEPKRGVSQSGRKGAILNSHTRGEYLDDEKFWAKIETA